MDVPAFLREFVFYLFQKCPNLLRMAQPEVSFGSGEMTYAHCDTSSERDEGRLIG